MGKLGNTGIEDIVILWYNEATEFFEMMDTTVNSSKSTVSTTTTHFSTYLMVYEKKWIERFKTDLYSGFETTTTKEIRFNTIGALDCSESIKKIDRQTVEYKQVPTPGATSSDKYPDYSSSRITIDNKLLDLYNIKE